MIFSFYPFINNRTNRWLISSILIHRLLSFSKRFIFFFIGDGLIVEMMFEDWLEDYLGWWLCTMRVMGGRLLCCSGWGQTLKVIWGRVWSLKALPWWCCYYAIPIYTHTALFFHDFYSNFFTPPYSNLFSSVGCCSGSYFIIVPCFLSFLNSVFSFNEFIIV